MRTVKEIKNILEAGLGKAPCDLKLTNLKLANVYSGEIYETNIYIKDKRIVSIDPEAHLEALEIMDCHGQYAIPGLIDGHIHFETTLLSPEALGDVIIPQGTTTVCVDPMEIANVAGIEGMEIILQSIEKLPYRTFIEIPSRVPTAPGLETTGGILGLKEVESVLDWKESISLGELDPSKILFMKEEYLEKIAATLQRRKIVNGHAIGRLGQELNVYASSGISDDHECVDYEELLARIRLGMTVMIREGSSERNVESLIKGVIENNLGFEHLLFCTDDKHASDIMTEGHINFNVNKAISLGVPPMQALQMATINAARHFRIEDEIGSITPGRLADILLVDNINHIQPNTVIFEGKVVATGEKLLTEKLEADYPQAIKETIKLKNPITAQSFALKAKKNTAPAKVNVIGIYTEQIINEWETYELPVTDGLITNDIKNDILKLAVVERYGKTGTVGIGFVKGFNLKEGALASSVSHDHHNIVCVGTNDEDMAIAVNAIHEIQGGFVTVLNGKVIGKIHLPIGGLMSEKTAQEVITENEAVTQSTRMLGCTLPAPFMTLSFISLPTVPLLGLTDMGLIDVLQHTIIDVEI
jgi:adenine deaminase